MPANNTEAELAQNAFAKIRNFVTVEPVLLALAIPFYLQTISGQNLALEKSCRVNLQFSTTVCDNMIDKALNGIHCGNVDVTVEQLNRTVEESEKNAESTAYDVKNGTDYSLIQQEACRAEIESQKLISTISGYMAPLESVIGIVVILIGGYWSDVTGRRKPLILFPAIGAFLALVVFLISATFMTSLPVEFTAVLVSLIEAISGGTNLLWMGIFCYVTDITQEKDRVFRFGLLYQLYPLVAICTLPFSGILYKKLGYIKLVLVSLSIQIFGIVYLILFLKEPRKEIDANQQIAEKASADRIHFDSEIKEPTVTAGRSGENKFESRQIDLFQRKFLEAANNFSVVLTRRRDGMKRTIIWLLLFSNFLFVGCEYEYVNEYFFVRTKLNWEALEESPFAAYSSTTAFLGNILMTTIFSKYFHFADVVIGLISSLFSSVAKLIYITVSTTVMLYVGRSFDSFLASSNVANRCILSTVVDQHEIGRIFSLTALLDNLSKFSFVTIYTNVYKHTVDTFPNAYFIVSFGAITTMAAIFGFLCFHMKDMSTSVTDAVVATTDSVDITMEESATSSAEEHQ
ncbi:uncharacterized protein LOC119083602 [Bradysia coprophila]|uniref:uncharacterized protein LOC119083602 n=1 Tax=Bradysia coprophila TaxID=38358 RepID=UPI00187D9083|nr:uncharacterized protein LOC119083602 [Bradysia coprophila]